MQPATLLQLGVTGLLAASVPLAMVWISSDANKYRKLVWVAVFLTFDLIVFGGFTRLTDSGLGCPDWPGCYGLANPFLAHEHIAAAQELMPTGPVTLVKAWIEMIHRYLAMGIGVLIVALMAKAWLQWRRNRSDAFAPALPTALFLFVCVQGAFGAWTVTLKLQPVIVSIHLLLGMGLLAMLAWLGGREDHLVKPQLAGGNPVALRGVRALALMSAAVLLVQVALGGWVSTNYATLACTDFPLCNGQLVPPMDFEHGFTLWRELGKTAAGEHVTFAALTAIHYAHRLMAYVLFAVLAVLAWRLRGGPLRRSARIIAGLALWQFASGLSNVILGWPLFAAVAHTGGAAALVVALTWALRESRATHAQGVPSLCAREVSA
jgi:cytochrome c oxidase assembly protein subunit 15